MCAFLITLHRQATYSQGNLEYGRAASISTTRPNHSQSWLHFDDPLSTKWPVSGNAHPSAQVAKEIEIIQTLVDVYGLRSENYHQHSANVSNCGGDGSTAVVEMKDQGLAKRKSQSKLGFESAKCGFGCNVFSHSCPQWRQQQISDDLCLFYLIYSLIVVSYSTKINEVVFTNSASLIKPFSHSPWVILTANGLEHLQLHGYTVVPPCAIRC